MEKIASERMITKMNTVSRGMLAVLMLLLSGGAMGQKMSLKGLWDFEVLHNNAKPEEVASDGKTKKRVFLPGTMLTNNKGDEVSIHTPWTGSLYDSSFYFNPAMEKYRVEGQCKFPFFLTPKKHFTGKARYSRQVTVPKQWKKGRVFLKLERPHIETEVRVNGLLVGKDSSLSVPHVFEITKAIRAGKNNSIDIDIYNGIENVCVGQDSHSVTDQTQGNWNGIVGELSLVCRPKVFIANVQVYPEREKKSVRVEYEIDGGEDICEVLTQIDNGSWQHHQLSRNEEGCYVLRLPLTTGQEDELRLWDEFTPNLYLLRSVINSDTVTTTFGVRDIAIHGRQFYINGRKMWLRGTVENCCFPLTGYPPTDEDEWRRIFETCKAYGINHVRFHSYCPPEAAFDAADKVGIYLQPEGPSWPNHGVKLKRGMSIDHYLMEETERMVREYGNHPSFCMLAAGNEPAGDWVTWCREFVDWWHATGDNRRVYCGASVGGGWAWDVNSDYHVKGGARGLDWDKRQPQSIDDYYSQLLLPRNFKTKGVPAHLLTTDTIDGKVTTVNNSPIIAHEQGQWCAFPDLDERKQYTGPYQPGNLDIFADLLQTNGMAEMGKKFLMASGKLQTLAYKAEIERNLRTKDYAGFQLLGLNDYSGQGSAMVGLLNVFWREKGYCDATMFRQFCSPLVPLARFPRFVFTQEDTLRVEVEAYNAGRSDLVTAEASYLIEDSEGKTMASGCFDVSRVSLGKNNLLGAVTTTLSAFPTPGKYCLKVSVKGTDLEQEQMSGNNSWEFWVYPSMSAESKLNTTTTDIFITDTLSDEAQKVLQRGGKVLLTAAGKVTFGSDVVQHYLPVFWNTSWFKMRPPHTVGAVIDTTHPLFQRFPSDDWANLNWWELLNRAQVMNLSLLPAEYQSPIQPIDTWHVSRKLGMIVEAQCGGGKVLITTMDISNNLSQRHVARQMRSALLDYMNSSDFRPQLTLPIAIMEKFFREYAPKVDMFTNDSPDELKPKIK